jgi:hypothetical protein
MNNPALYDVVIAGGAASSGAWLTNEEPTSYASERAALIALATEIDLAIPPISSGPSLSQVFLLNSISQNVFGGRNPTSIDPASYAHIASAIAALFQELSAATSNPPIILAMGHIHDDGSGPVIQSSYNVASVVYGNGTLPPAELRGKSPIKLNASFGDPTPIPIPGFYVITFITPINLEHCDFPSTYHSDSSDLSDAGLMFEQQYNDPSNSLQLVRVNLNNGVQPGAFSFHVIGKP